MCVCVIPDTFESTTLLLLHQESLITPLPVPERAGTGLSRVNEMNFGRHHVGGLATAPEMCVFCVKDFH